MFANSGIGCTAHVMAIDIMDLCMCCLTFFIMELYVLWKFSPETCRLVHIIPDAPDAHIQKFLMMICPPVSHFFPAKIREYRFARPYFIHINISLGVFCKIAFFNTFLIHEIAVLFLCSRIDNRHRLETKLFHFVTKHAFFIIIFFVPCKHFEIVHVVNIQMNDIARNLQFAIFLCNFHDILCGCVAPAGLMIAQCPKLWQRCSSSKVCIIFDDLCHGLSAKNVIIQISVIRTITEIFLRLFSKIQIAVERIVKEQTIHTIFAQTNQKWNGFVQCMKILVVCLRKIGVPILVFIVALVDKSAFVPESIKAVFRCQHFQCLYCITPTC